jgi:hypothetical protein
MKPSTVDSLTSQDPKEQDMPRKFSIGEVGFGSPCSKEQNAAGWRLESFLGKLRVELLKKARAGEVLPNDWFLVGQVDGGGFRRATAAEVDWEGLDFYLANHGR